VAAMTRTSTVIEDLRSDRFEVLLLEDAQHLGLGLEAHVTDLVEEERCAIQRRSNLPRFGLCRAR
jgi:hypothetical protein